MTSATSTSTPSASPGQPAASVAAASRSAASEEEQAWGAWFGQLAPAIADMGNRVGATRTLPAARRGEPGRAVLTGYVVVDAANLDAAATLAAGCPGLADGVDVEVAEVIAS